MSYEEKYSKDGKMLHVAELYYFEQMTQSAIAKRLSISRWTVGRILEEARQCGLVKITIEHPRARHHLLEQKLQHMFSLRKAIVVPAQSSDDLSLELVSQVAAQELSEFTPSLRTVAISWGRTTSHLAKHLVYGWNPDVQIVQTNGGVALTRNDLVGRFIGRVAELGPGKSILLQGPAVLNSASLAASLRKDAAIYRALDTAKTADTVIYSPGPVTQESILVAAGFISKVAIRKLQDQGGVADVMSHFIDRNGNIIDSELDERTLSLPLDYIRTKDVGTHRRPRNILVVAAGKRKAQAVQAVVRNGLCTDVIIDSSIAEYLVG